MFEIGGGEFNNLSSEKCFSSRASRDLEITRADAKKIGGCPLVTIRVASQLNRMDPNLVSV